MNNSNRNSTSGTSNINKRKSEFDAVNYKPPLPSKLPNSSGFKKPGFKKPPPPSVFNQPSFNKPVSTKPDSNINNLLLAGYLAHEFLSKGTLFGEQWDPARADTGPTNSKQIIPKAEPSIKAAEVKSSSSKDKHDRYVEVACLLKSDGVHIPGVVNPTQLERFLHM